MSYQPDPEKSAGNGSLVSLFFRLQEVLPFLQTKNRRRFCHCRRIVVVIYEIEPEIQDGIVGRFSTKLPVYKRKGFCNHRYTLLSTKKCQKRSLVGQTFRRASKPPHQVTTMYALAVHV